MNDQNPQLNITELVCELMKLAIEKSDRTVVDLGDSMMVLFYLIKILETKQINQGREWLS